MDFSPVCVMRAPKTEPLQSWISHLRFVTVAESTNLIHHSTSTVMKNRGVLHITRSLVRTLVQAQKNCVKLTTHMIEILHNEDQKGLSTPVANMQRNLVSAIQTFEEFLKDSVSDKIWEQLNKAAKCLSRDTAALYVLCQSYITGGKNSKRRLSKLIVEHIATVKSRVSEAVIIMIIETYKVIMRRIEKCSSDLLNQTVLKEIATHFSEKSLNHFIASAMQRAGAVAFLIRYPSEPSYKVLVQLCRFDERARSEMSERIAELCTFVRTSKDTPMQLPALQILMLLTSHAVQDISKSKEIIGHKRSTSLDYTNDRPHPTSIREVLPFLLELSELTVGQLRWHCSKSNLQVNSQTYVALLSILCDVMCINDTQGNDILVTDTCIKSVDILLEKLKAVSTLDDKSRERMATAFALLATYPSARCDMAQVFVIQLLLQILCEAHGLPWTGAYTGDLTLSQISVAKPDIVSNREKRFSDLSSSSCSSHMSEDYRNSTGSISSGSSGIIKKQKRVTWASDHGFALTVSDDSRHEPRKSPIIVKSAMVDRRRNYSDSSLSKIHPKTEKSKEFSKHVRESTIQKCVMTLSRLCSGVMGNEMCVTLRNFGGIQLLTNIVKCEKTTDAVLLACLVFLRQLAAVNEKGFNPEDIQKLIRPRLVDTYLLCSSVDESFV